jgi:transposase
MSHHMTGQGRNQVTLFPEALDDFVNVENPVRVIDVFVDELNLASLGFNKVMPKNTGRLGYHPATMLKLYIYGYLDRVQSSRRLERETQRNVETMWLLERLTLKPLRILEKTTARVLRTHAFNRSLFKYDKDKDIYICPAGETLPHRRNVVESRRYMLIISHAGTVKFALNAPNQKQSRGKCGVEYMKPILTR